MTAEKMGHLLRSHRGRRASVAVAAGLLVAFTSTMRADDWPEWRGAGRVAVWKQTGLLERFPEAGLKVTWRTPVHAGYSGPAVANGRVYVTDARTTTGKRTVERVRALDELRGAVIWSREWETNYSGLENTSLTVVLSPPLRSHPDN